MAIACGYQIRSRAYFRQFGPENPRAFLATLPPLPEIFDGLVNSGDLASDTFLPSIIPGFQKLPFSLSGFGREPCSTICNPARRRCPGRWVFVYTSYAAVIALSGVCWSGRSGVGRGI